MVYTLRPKNPNVAYLESCAEANNNASDPNNNDPDYARSTPRHARKRRNATLYTSRAMRTGILEPTVDSNGKRRRSTRGRPSEKTEAGGQNREASGDRQSLSPSTENGTPSPIGPSTLLPSMTGDEEHNKETSEIGQRLGQEKSSFLSTPSPVEPSTLLPSTTGDEGHNKETNDIEQRLGKEKSSFLPEDQGSPMEKTSKKTLEERLIPSEEKDLAFEGHNSSNEKVPSLPEGTGSSKRTILSLLMDCKIIEEDEQVYYMDDTKESVAITGAITRVGILCSCCQEEISVWTFEKHADSDLKQPYEHICLPRRGTCLKDFLTTAWYDSTEQKRREPFDYTLKYQINSACLICGDGGDLFYCMNKGCQSAYHAFCMNMKRIPRGTWNCPYCVCKYCGLECQLQPITCLQCHKIFHLGCSNKFSKESKEISSSRLYCSQSCQEIYEKLKSSLATRTDIGEGNSWRVIQPVDMTSKLHLDRTLRLENNLKVAVAFKLMEESFKTKTYTNKGIDVVNGVLYSHRSNLKRINFSRFHTFILEKDDAIICAASIRIHGRMVAEMPFIATDEIFRGQGFCSKLMKAIESYLRDLKVQNLIIPAVPDTCKMWKLKYGFKELTAQLRKDVSSYNILMFPNAIKLYKSLSSLVEGPEPGKVNNEKQTENHNTKKIQDKNTKTTLLDMNMEGLEPGKVNNEKQAENHNAKEIQDKNTKRTLLEMNMEGPEPGKVNNENQTENQNTKEIQDKNTKRTLLDMNMEGPEPGKVNNEKQTENHNAKEIQDKNTERTLLDMNMEGPEPGKVNNEKQTENQNTKEIQDKNTKRTLLDMNMEGPEPGKVDNEKQTENHNAKEIQDNNTERALLEMNMEGPEPGKVNNEKQTENHNAKEIQDNNTERTLLEMNMEGPEPGKVDNEKQTENHNAKEIQDKNTKRTLLDMNMEGPEPGKVNNEKQTENHNAKEIQDKNPRRTLLDLNMDPCEEDD